MTIIKIYPVAHSGNSKTGDIAQTYSSEATCPSRCPFKNSGCYAESFHCRQAWRRAEKAGLDPAELAAWVRENTDVGALIRHNVAGDLATPGTSDINAGLLESITEAFDGRRAYTYTHCSPDARNFGLIRKAIGSGFIVNQSCERLDQVDAAMSAGVPAVLAVTEYKKGLRTPEGRAVVLCPAQAVDGMTCKRCGLCAKAGRKSAIAFVAHGSSARKARSAIQAVNN